MRVLFAAATIAFLAPTAALADAVTTRIETRPFYGATVTIEHGVRVYRPLPRHDRVIINPNGAASINLMLDARRPAPPPPAQPIAIPGGSLEGGDGAYGVYGGPGYGDRGQRHYRGHRPGGYGVRPKIIHVRPQAPHRGGGKH